MLGYFNFLPEQDPICRRAIVPSQVIPAAPAEDNPVAYHRRKFFGCMKDAARLIFAEGLPAETLAIKRYYYHIYNVESLSELDIPTWAKIAAEMQAIAQDKPPYPILRQWCKGYAEWVEETRRNYQEGSWVFGDDLFILSGPIDRQWKLYKEGLAELTRSSDLQWPGKQDLFGKVNAHSFVGRVRLLYKPDIWSAIRHSSLAPIHWPTLRILYLSGKDKVTVGTWALPWYLEGIVHPDVRAELGYPDIPEDVLKGLEGLSHAALKRIGAILRIQGYTVMKKVELIEAIKRKLVGKIRVVAEVQRRNTDPLLEAWYLVIREEIQNERG